MDSKKEEALRQLENIHTVLVEEPKFFPYDFRAFILWGIIASVLFLFAETFFAKSLTLGVIFLVFFLGGGFIVEYFLIKRENASYDMQHFTKKQKFVETVFIHLSVFAILLSVLLIRHDLDAFVYPVWIFLISLGSFIAAFIVSSKIYRRYAAVAIASAFVLLCINLWFDFFALNRYVAVVIVGFGYIYLGFRLKREFGNV